MPPNHPCQLRIEHRTNPRLPAWAIDHVAEPLLVALSVAGFGMAAARAMGWLLRSELRVDGGEWRPAPVMVTRAG